MAKKTKTIEQKIDEKIDNLAGMVQGGFDEAYKRMDAAEKRLTIRLDRIEFYATGHERRVEILEDRVRQLAVKVGYKFN